MQKQRSPVPVVMFVFSRAIAVSRRVSQRANLAHTLSRAAPRAHIKGVGSSASSIPAALPDEKQMDPWHIKRENTPSLIHDIKSEDDLNSLLASAKPEALVVVKYYSSRCSSSKEIERKYEETVIEFRDIAGPGSIHFAQVNLDDSRSLFEHMGIVSTPYLQIFSGKTGKIADFSVAPSKFDTLPSLLKERREAALTASKHD